LFADDSLLFFKATTDQATLVRNTLAVYEKGTGQLLSPTKCSLLLGKKCTEEDGEEMAAILQISTVGFDEKYLGLPVPEGCMKKGKFQPIRERYEKKLSDWTEKYGSSGAKEVLIKSVAQAISTYAMSVFKFSAGLCDDLMQMTRKFWWDDEDDKRHIHWTSWDKLIQKKIERWHRLP
jgi:hypothetical protein